MSRSAWRLDWLTPRRCRLILALLLVFGFFSHLRYLHYNCPIDLAPDEAQYWDWSRSLDISYYSKGPLVAYIIRASCAIFGETMPAVRYPALVLAVATSIVTYLLTRKLFGSERLALGAVLMFHLVPMFIAGSVLMTIDAPMFFCWALATYFAMFAIYDDKRWMWIFVGIAIGVGFLAKYAAFLWYPGLFGYLLFAHDGRKRKRAVALVAPVVSALFSLPVIIWNARHDWVSFHHVVTQTGSNATGKFSILSPPEMIGGQFGLVSPPIAVMMIAGIVYALRRRLSADDPHRAKLLLLGWIGLAFFAANLLASFRTKIQPNWPAPAYFTLMILTAYFVATRLKSVRTWKPWRGWFYASIVIALIFMPVAHDTSIIFPVMKPIARLLKRDMSDMDPLARLRGWQTLGRYVANELAVLRPGAFILCDDYMQTAETAFYVPGQPKTYCAGSYYGKRLSQYDMWPDRRLDHASPLVGQDAVYVGKSGKLPIEVENAFDRVEKQPELDINVGDVRIRSFKTWRCYGFKGMQRRDGATEY